MRPKSPEADAPRGSGPDVTPILKRSTRWLLATLAAALTLGIPIPVLTSSGVAAAQSPDSAELHGSVDPPTAAAEPPPPATAEPLPPAAATSPESQSNRLYFPIYEAGTPEAEYAGVFNSLVDFMRRNLGIWVRNASSTPTPGLDTELQTEVLQAMRESVIAIVNYMLSIGITPNQIADFTAIEYFMVTVDPSAPGGSTAVTRQDSSGSIVDYPYIVNVILGLNAENTWAATSNEAFHAFALYAIVRAISEWGSNIGTLAALTEFLKNPNYPPEKLFQFEQFLDYTFHGYNVVAAANTANGDRVYQTITPRMPHDFFNQREWDVAGLIAEYKGALFTNLSIIRPTLDGIDPQALADAMSLWNNLVKGTNLPVSAQYMAKIAPLEAAGIFMRPNYLYQTPGEVAAIAFCDLQQFLRNTGNPNRFVEIVIQGFQQELDPTQLNPLGVDDYKNITVTLNAGGETLGSNQLNVSMHEVGDFTASAFLEGKGGFDLKTWFERQFSARKKVKATIVVSYKTGKNARFELYIEEPMFVTAAMQAQSRPNRSVTKVSKPRIVPAHTAAELSAIEAELSQPQPVLVPIDERAELQKRLEQAQREINVGLHLVSPTQQQPVPTPRWSKTRRQ